MSKPKFKNPVVNWIDYRLPIFTFMNHELNEYPTPKNLNYFWNFGSLAGITLVIMIVTGIVLSMNYTAHIDYAFDSVERIMRDVNHGWLLRYIHMNGASFFFIVVYIHIFRGLYYGSYKAPREILWILGVLILLLMMATAFMGYVLPWGQMSFWGATVITNLFSAIPLVGESIVTWLWGGFSVDNPTLNRFFSLHFVLPFVIVGVVILHLVALHRFGSNNPIGIDVKGKQAKNSDGKPFACGCAIKDISSLSSDDSDQYKPLLSSSITAKNWQDVSKVSSSDLSILMAESTPQEDVKGFLGSWGNGTTSPAGAKPGWLARFVRQFYYMKLQIMSTCYWEPNDLIYADLKNVRDRNNKRVPNMDGFTWLTAAEASPPSMNRFVVKDESSGELILDANGPYTFDPINVYQLTPQGSTLKDAAILGLGGAGDKVSISGMFGICNDRTYQFGQFSQRIGIYIAIGIVVIALIFVMLDHGIGRAHGASFENPEMVAASSSKGDADGAE